MRELKVSTAANVMLFVADESDPNAGLAGLTLTVTLKKDGAAFAAITPTVTDRGNGWYEFALTTAHTDTAGDLIVRATAAGAIPAERALVVVPLVASDLGAGQNAIVSPTATRPAHLNSDYVPGEASLQQAFTDTVAAMDVIPTAAENATQVWANGTRSLTDKAGFGLSSSERSALADAIEAAIIDESDPEKVLAAITAKIAEANPDLSGLTIGAITSAVWSAAARTLTAYPGLSVPSAAENATQVRTELATELGRLDAAVSTRLATAGYTAPLDAAGMRAALGMASADLDTQLDAIQTAAEAGGGAADTPLDSGTAQAGGSNTITLRAGTTITPDTECSIELVSGPGAGEERWVESYDGTTEVATMVGGWLTAPTSATTYRVWRTGGSDQAANRAAMADKLLGRNVAGGSDGGHTVARALRVWGGDIAFADDGTFAVKAEDGTTDVATGTYQADDNGNITSLSFDA